MVGRTPSRGGSDEVILAAGTPLDCRLGELMASELERRDRTEKLGCYRVRNSLLPSEVTFTRSTFLPCTWPRLIAAPSTLHRFTGRNSAPRSPPL